MGLDALLAERIEKIDLCKLGRIIGTLEDPYKSALTNLLAVGYYDGGESDDEIAERLRLAEMPISSATVNRHRNGRCGCPKTEEVVR